jgi:hypothetical protein
MNLGCGEACAEQMKLSIPESDTFWKPPHGLVRVRAFQTTELWGKVDKHRATETDNTILYNGYKPVARDYSVTVSWSSQASRARSASKW